MYSKLTKDLDSAQREKDEEVQKRDDLIQKLKENLLNVEMLAEENTKNMIDNMNSEKHKIETKSELNQKRLIEEISPKVDDLRKLIVKHREVELDLRGRKFRLETEVQGLVSKYDDFMIDKQDELERVQDAYDIEKEELDDLRERFTKLSVDYDAIMEERRLQAEEEERQRKELEMKTYNATVIQAFFRSYKVRKLLKAKAKKAKKGKKGKKGK